MKQKIENKQKFFLKNVQVGYLENGNVQIGRFLHTHPDQIRQNFAT